MQLVCFLKMVSTYQMTWSDNPKDPSLIVHHLEHSKSYIGCSLFGTHPEYKMSLSMRSLLFLGCLSLEDWTDKLSQYVNYQSTLCHISLTLRRKPEITSLHFFVVLLSLPRMLLTHILGLITGSALHILQYLFSPVIF
jgi:hypothetical protein